MTWLNRRKRVHFAQAIEELSKQKKYYNHKKILACLKIFLVSFFLFPFIVIMKIKKIR